MNLLSIAAIGCGLALLPFLSPSEPETPPPSGGRYIGAAACKNCHNGADKGNCFDHWAQTKHAKAYENLAGDKAKEAGKKLGIDEPQKSEKCLKCHVTAYGLDKKEIKATFKMELGVQCETCHGPGEDHQKKRFAESQKTGATPAPMTPEEIKVDRSVETCKKCHNEESPTYKPFCMKERMKEVEHLDPRKKRSEEELKKLRETCTPDCTVCKTGGEAKDEKKPEGGK